MSKRKSSEFGQGFVYNLVLFAKHFYQATEMQTIWAEMRKKNPTLFSKEDSYSLWFNAAGDHFYDLVIPKKLAKTAIAKLALSLQTRAIHYRLANCSENEFLVFWYDLEKLTRLIDKQLGVVAIEAGFN